MRFLRGTEFGEVQLFDPQFADATALRCARRSKRIFVGGNELHVYDEYGHGGRVVKDLGAFSIALDTDARRFATGDADGTIRITTLTPDFKLDASESEVVTAATCGAVMRAEMSDDGRWYMGSSSGDGLCRVWDTRSGQLEYCQWSSSCVAMSRDGEHLGMEEGADIRIRRSWFSLRDEGVVTLPSPQPRMLEMAICCDATLLVAFEDGTMICHESNGRTRWSKSIPKKWLTELRLSPDDSLVVLGDFDGGLTILSMKDGETVASASWGKTRDGGNRGPIYAVDWLSDTRIAALSVADEAIWVVSIER